MCVCVYVFVFVCVCVKFVSCVYDIATVLSMWHSIPAVEIMFPESKGKYSYFARFLMEGCVLPVLKKYLVPFFPSQKCFYLFRLFLSLSVSLSLLSLSLSLFCVCACVCVCVCVCIKACVSFPSDLSFCCVCVCVCVCVFVCLSPLTLLEGALKGSPVQFTQNWALPRVELFVKRLQRRKVCSKATLISEWKKNPRFLLGSFLYLIL